MNADNWISIVAVIVAVIALVTAFWTYWITRDHLLLERVHRLSDRLYEFDRIIMQFPELQCLLYQEAQRNQPYFAKETEHNDLYFRVKTLVYTQINLWDEIFCVVEGNKRLEKTFEFEDWKSYILKKMRHPLFRELFNRESSIWGKKFQAFIESNRSKLLEPADPDMF